MTFCKTDRKTLKPCEPVDFPIFRRIRSGTAGSTAAFSGLRMRPVFLETPDDLGANFLAEVKRPVPSVSKPISNPNTSCWGVVRSTRFISLCTIPNAKAFQQNIAAFKIFLQYVHVLSCSKNSSEFAINFTDLDELIGSEKSARAWSSQRTEPARPSGARPSGRNRASEMLPVEPSSLPLLRGLGGAGGDAGAPEGEAGDLF